MPVVPERVSGQRGRVAKPDAYNLWDRLKTYEAAVLLFVQEANASFTNSRAERDLRMLKNFFFTYKNYRGYYCYQRIFQ